MSDLTNKHYLCKLKKIILFFILIGLLIFTPIKALSEVNVVSGESVYICSANYDEYHKCVISSYFNITNNQPEPITIILSYATNNSKSTNFSLNSGDSMQFFVEFKANNGLFNLSSGLFTFGNSRILSIVILKINELNPSFAIVDLIYAGTGYDYYNLYGYSFQTDNFSIKDVNSIYIDTSFYNTGSMGGCLDNCSIKISIEQPNQWAKTSTIHKASINKFEGSINYITNYQIQYESTDIPVALFDSLSKFFIIISSLFVVMFVAFGVAFLVKKLK